MRAIEVASYFRRLNALIEEQDGELTPEQEQQLLDDKATIDDKVDALYEFAAEAEVKHSFYAQRANELMGVANHWDRVAKAHRRLLMEILRVAGLKQAGSTPPIILVKNGRPSFSWDKIGYPIPEEMQRIKVELDQAKVYAAWKEGFVADGVKVTEGYHIRCKHRRKGQETVDDS